MGISIKNIMNFYTKENSLTLKEYENNYELDIPSEKIETSTTNTILNLVKEIAYSRKRNCPSQQKVKSLREYRDYDLSLK